MISFRIAGVVLGCALCGLLVGLLLRKVLPEHHTKDESKDVMKTASGMMATLIALIIGLLVSSAKSTFDSANSAITQSGAKIILLDRTLARYGPETAGIRELLRQTVTTGMKDIWPEDQSGKADVVAAETRTGMDEVIDMIRALAPKNESQQHMKSQALQFSSEMLLSRWTLIEQNQNTLPMPFLIVLSFWLAVLFACFGLLAPPHFTSLSALTVCAVSMAAAIYLISELNRPLEGSIKVSKAPLVKALSIIGK